MCGKWTRPVKIEICGSERLVAGPAQALECLNDWPVASGWFYERAKNRCHAALEMGADAESARQAFLAATIEAALDCETPDRAPMVSAKDERIVFSYGRSHRRAAAAISVETIL